MVAIRQILSAALVLVSCSQVAAEQSLRLDRNDLLQFRDADGQLHRVATPAEWQNRRADILQGMQEVMGDAARRGSTRAAGCEGRGRDSGRNVCPAAHLLTSPSPDPGRPPTSASPRMCWPASARRQRSSACIPPITRWGTKSCLGLGGTAGQAVRRGAGRTRICHPFTVLPTFGGLLAEPRTARLRQRHDESDLGQFPRPRSARLASLCGRLTGLRRHRPFVGWPQRDLHGRVRPADHGFGQQLRI